MKSARTRPPRDLSDRAIQAGFGAVIGGVFGLLATGGEHPVIAFSTGALVCAIPAFVFGDRFWGWFGNWGSWIP